MASLRPTQEPIKNEFGTTLQNNHMDDDLDEKSFSERRATNSLPAVSMSISSVHSSLTSMSNPLSHSKKDVEDGYSALYVLSEEMKGFYAQISEQLNDLTEDEVERDAIKDYIKTCMDTCAAFEVRDDESLYGSLSTVSAEVLRLLSDGSIPNDIKLVAIRQIIAPVKAEPFASSAPHRALLILKGHQSKLLELMTLNNQKIVEGFVEHYIENNPELAGYEAEFTIRAKLALALPDAGEIVTPEREQSATEIKAHNKMLQRFYGALYVHTTPSASFYFMITELKSELDQFVDLEETQYSDTKDTTGFPALIDKITSLTGRAPFKEGAQVTLADLKKELPVAVEHYLSDNVMKCNALASENPKPPEGYQKWGSSGYQKLCTAYDLYHCAKESRYKVVEISLKHFKSIDLSCSSDSRTASQFFQAIKNTTSWQELIEFDGRLSEALRADPRVDRNLAQTWQQLVHTQMRVLDKTVPLSGYIEHIENKKDLKKVASLVRK